MFLGLSVLKLAGSFPWPFELGNDRKASEPISHTYTVVLQHLASGISMLQFRASVS